MTIAIVLGGNSKRSNEQWSKDLATAVKPYFESVIPFAYDHWAVDGDISWDDESKKLIELTKELSDDYVILAKSIGSALTATLVCQNKIYPKSCIFMGMPIKEDKTFPLGVSPQIDKFTKPVTVIQNPTERFMKPEQLILFLKEKDFKHFTVIIGKGQEHSYPIEQVVEILEQN